jgi:hypothetical protein
LVCVICHLYREFVTTKKSRIGNEVDL